MKLQIRVGKDGTWPFTWWAVREHPAAGSASYHLAFTRKGAIRKVVREYKRSVRGHEEVTTVEVGS